MAKGEPASNPGSPGLTLIELAEQGFLDVAELENDRI